MVVAQLVRSAFLINKRTEVVKWLHGWDWEGVA